MSLRAILTLPVLMLAYAAAASPTPLSPAPLTTGPTQQQLDAADTDPTNWLTYNKGYLGYRYSSLNAISTATASQVKLLCTANLGFQGGFETGPVVYNGVLYATAGLSTYAIDAATCAVRWTYTHPVTRGRGPVNRGVALAEGRVFRGAGDGHLIALDAQSGHVLWDRQIMDLALGELAVGSPVAWGGLVFFGKAGGDAGIQGQMMAFRATDGSKVWGFHTTPTPGQPGGNTWPTVFSATHGGGATWSSFSIDEARGLLLLPVGNPGPDYNKTVRAGANLFTDSIVALNAKTGRLVWSHQLRGGDDRDWDTTVVASIPAAGGLDLAAGAGKDGTLHLVDRATGALLHKTPLVERYLNTNTPVPKGAGLRLCPIAAVQWNGPAYSPATNLIYMNGIDWCAQAIQGPVPVYHPGQGYGGWANGGGTRDPIAQAVGIVNAIDPATGGLVWRVHTAALPLGALVATGGGVVVAGELNGEVALLDAARGTQLAAVNVGQPIGGGIVSYVAGGKQRLAVAAGITSRDYGTTGTGTIAVLGVP